MFRILAFWTWGDGEAPAAPTYIPGGMMMVHAGYIRRQYRQKIGKVE